MCLGHSTGNQMKREMVLDVLACINSCASFPRRTAFNSKRHQSLRPFSTTWPRAMALSTHAPVAIPRPARTLRVANAELLNPSSTTQLMRRVAPMLGATASPRCTVKRELKRWCSVQILVATRSCKVDQHAPTQQPRSIIGVLNSWGRWTGGVR